MAYRIGTAASVRLDVGSPDYLAPFLGFVGDQFPKFSGREREHGATQVGKARLDLGIGEAGVDLFVELVDDLCGRIPGSTDPPCQPIPRNPARSDRSPALQQSL